MRITINDIIVIEPWVELEYTLENVFFSMQVKESFGRRESVTAHDIAITPMISLRGRARLLSHLLGPRDVKREVARRIVRDALGDREIPALYRTWLDTGDEALRKGALDAACAAADAAADATIDVAAWDVAWVAADFTAGVVGGAAGLAGAVADAAVGAAVDWANAWERYLGWMAEWLDGNVADMDKIKWWDVDVYDADVYEDADLAFAKLGDLMRDFPAYLAGAIVVEGKIVLWPGFSLSHDTEDINWEGFPIKNADGRKMLV